MSFIDKLDRHERLMSRLAAANGADLPLAEQVGLVTPEEVFEAALNCTGCASVGACEKYLEGGAYGVPDYCRNRGIIREVGQTMNELGLAEA